MIDVFHQVTQKLHSLHHCTVQIRKNEIIKSLSEMHVYIYIEFI